MDDDDEGDSLSDDTIGDDSTLAGETVLDDGDDYYTYLEEQEGGPIGQVESFLEDLAEVDGVGTLGRLCFPDQCGPEHCVVNDDDDDEYTYATDTGTIFTRQANKFAIGGILFAAGGDCQTAVEDDEITFEGGSPRRQAVNPDQEQWPLLAHLKAKLDSLHSTATTAADGTSRGPSFWDSLFSCNG